MSRYRDIIKQATGCSESQALEIEDCMRNVIFHSTLDWQSRAELEEAARVAVEVIREAADLTNERE
jgi:hypothetical protein